MGHVIPDWLDFWIKIASAVGVTVAANAVGVLWAGEVRRWAWFIPLDGWLNWWLPLMIVLGMLVFATFGHIGASAGLSGASTLIDSLLTPFSVLVGLFLFNERERTTTAEYFVIAGIIVLAIILRYLQVARGAN